MTRKKKGDIINKLSNERRIARSEYEKRNKEAKVKQKRPLEGREQRKQCKEGGVKRKRTERKKYSKKYLTKRLICDIIDKLI